MLELQLRIYKEYDKLTLNVTQAVCRRLDHELTKVGASSLIFIQQTAPAQRSKVAAACTAAHNSSVVLLLFGPHDEEVMVKSCHRLRVNPLKSRLDFSILK